MRKTLNRKLIEEGREAPCGEIERQRDLHWEAYLQLHCRAQDMGILERDSELHDVLDARLAHFEEGGESI